MRELIPPSKSFSLLVNPANRVNFDIAIKSLEASSRTLGLQLHVLNASTELELEAAFANRSQLRGGLIISADIFFNSRGKQLAGLTLKHAVPAVHTVRAFAAAGGLMSYGGNITGNPQASRHLHGPHPERRKTGRPASSAGYHGRVDYQSQDRQSARFTSPKYFNWPRRRSDRVIAPRAHLGSPPPRSPRSRRAHSRRCL